MTDEEGEDWLKKLNIFLLLDDNGTPFHELIDLEREFIATMCLLGLTPAEAHMQLESMRDEGYVFEVGTF